MSLINVNFHSESLHRKVFFNAVIPIRTKKPLKTVYLLHGIYGDCTSWLVNTRAAYWAEERGIALILPSADNSFYLDNKKGGALYAEFFGRELVAVTRELFPLSHERGDTFAAGLSMGGYGAVCTGLKYSDTFGAAAGLSAAFITEEMPPLDDNSPVLIEQRGYYEFIFGDLSKIAGSDKDPKALVAGLKRRGASLPRIYLCCGTDDFLIEQNRDFHRFLCQEKVAHTYVENAGAHNWDYWNDNILDVFDWLLATGKYCQ
ncbi:MAG: alpha/beta hydrolase-fold protein [Defluviitaleaceae bacterium]|nr:alpha/beta hydrolase-fold protein [Defluviitaleaceae bacterium]